MKCPKCGSEDCTAKQWVKNSPLYCIKCHCMWTEWQAAEIESLKAQLKSRDTFYKKQRDALERSRPLCPDCRDKQHARPCLGCTIQSLQSLLNVSVPRSELESLKRKLKILREGLEEIKRLEQYSRDQFNPDTPFHLWFAAHYRLQLPNMCERMEGYNTGIEQCQLIAAEALKGGEDERHGNM